MEDILCQASPFPFRFIVSGEDMVKVESVNHFNLINIYECLLDTRHSARDMGSKLKTTVCLRNFK